MTVGSVSLPPRAGRVVAWCRAVVDKTATTVRFLRERLAAWPRSQPAGERPATTVPPTPSDRDSGPQRCPAPHAARVLSLLVGAGVAVSSALGLVMGDLYREPASVVAMFRGLDAVNLALAVPLLVALSLSKRGSLPGQLLWAGTLGYTLYTYALYVFGLSFNAAFLLHAAILASAIHALVLVLASVDTAEIARRMPPRTPARIAATLLGLLGLGLGGMWAYYAARFALTGQAPQESLLVQTPAGIHLSYAADLVLLVPAYLLAAVLLWRGAPWGYLLGGTLLTAGTLQQVGYLAELAAQARAGIPGAAPFDPNEPPILAAYLVGAVLLLAGVRRRPSATADDAPSASTRADVQQ